MFYCIIKAKSNFTVRPMEINCLAFFFLTGGNVYQMLLSHTLGRDPNESLIRTQNVIKDKAFRKDKSLLLVLFKGR